MSTELSGVISRLEIALPRRSLPGNGRLQDLGQRGLPQRVGSQDERESPLLPSLAASDPEGYDALARQDGVQEAD